MSVSTCCKHKSNTWRDVYERICVVLATDFVYNVCASIPVPEIGHTIHILNGIT